MIDRRAIVDLGANVAVDFSAPVGEIPVAGFSYILNAKLTCKGTYKCARSAHSVVPLAGAASR
jgi:hypothetical protein